MKADLKKIGVTVIETFISHMVQMKVPSGYGKDSWKMTLYPTWFRWKDEYNVLLTEKENALYPTWFRWKA